MQMGHMRVFTLLSRFESTIFIFSLVVPFAGSSAFVDAVQERQRLILKFF